MLRNENRFRGKMNSVGELFGYARVSTDEQDVLMQIEALKRAGVSEHRIYQDKRSGKDLKRVGINDCLSHMRRGDVLVVWRFDRLSRSLRDLLAVFDQLQERGIQLRSIHEQLDTTSPMGKLMFQLAGMLAEFERALIAERTRLGMQTARAHGRRFGPKPTLTEKKLDRAVAMLRAGQSVGVVARRMGVANVTLREKILKVTGKKLWPDGPRTRAKRKKP